MNFKVLSENKIILLLVPGITYNQSILKFSRTLSNRYVCYVTLNKSFSALVESFKYKRVKADKFFFIDCVTKTVISPAREKNVSFIKSPSALTDLSLAIKKQLPKSDIIVIDSLSTLLIYHEPDRVANFIHNIINKVQLNKKTILIVLMSKSDSDNTLFKKVEVMVNKVVKLT
ncbi:MAG: ATPase domain-containing protein [Candidatus Nanoarchaeia archaeon]|jgi:hypothetical protein